MKTEFDVIVIGMGVGGEEVAGRTADAGLEVLAVEKKLVGGECPYWGCIPSKMMLRAAQTISEAGRVNEMAGSSSVKPDWSPVAQRIRNEATDTWNDKVAIERHEGKGTVVLKAEARLVGPGEVEVEGTRYSARRAIVIATGGDPMVPPIDGLSEVEFWTNREAVEAKEAPDSMIVLGGGPIGLEIAQAFHAFGTDITVIEMQDHLLPLDEPENGDALKEAFEDAGMSVRLGVSADSVARTNRGIEVTLSDGGKVAGERLLVATGRTIDLGSLGVDAIGCDPKARSLSVDENLRVTDGVWAVGDVTGVGAFTHLAVYQGRLAAADILGEDHEPAEYSALPRVTFTDPEVASVGLTEAQARDKGLDVAVGKATTSSSARGWIHGPGARHGLTKLVADAGSKALVGASTMGPAAGEVLGMLALAVKEKTPVATLREMIFPYPTFVRGVEDALRDLDI